MFEIGLQHYLTLASVLAAAGLFVILTKRNAVAILIGVELVLNAASVNLAAFSRYATGDIEGQTTSLFIIVLAAAEAAIALAIFLNFYSNLASVDVDYADQLKG